MAQIPDHKARNVGADIYGPARLELARHVAAALDAAEQVWFLDSGTLLGAFRNGRQIPHDDDFDIAVYLPVFRGEADLIALRDKLLPALPPPYAIRSVTSYAQKIEIYDPASDSFMLPMPYYRGADFHTVTVDVQVMTDRPDGAVGYLHDMLGHIRVPQDALAPTGEIVLDGHTFNSPRHVERFLEALYGYLGADARFDPHTKKYVRDSGGAET